MHAACTAAFVLAAIAGAAAQDEAPPNARNPSELIPLVPAATGQPAGGAAATLHGVVLNAVTGEGIPRALVQIEGDTQTGALTDGDGRFEIAGVPPGPRTVLVTKPGYFNPAFGGDDGQLRDSSGPTENVLVAAEMPDVEFTLAPRGSIRGRIDLAGGDPAEGIEVALVRRAVQDGRAAWQWVTGARTRSDGTYRFGGLPDGQYEVYTLPAFDGNPAAPLVAPGKQTATERWGYASVFYPGARDSSGAQALAVANGAQVQANFLLTREPFQAVAAQVVLPQEDADEENSNCSLQVIDGAGQDLPYTAQYDARAHTVQAWLPEGNYSILVTWGGSPSKLEGREQPLVLVGSVDFAVADHAVTGLRVPLSAPALAPVQVTVNRSGTAPLEPQNSQIAVMVSPAGGGNSGGMVTQYASGTAEGPLQAGSVTPGAYWVHTYVNARGLCEQSFTAGGANLAREPLTVGSAGATGPLELTLRDDCAQLALQLPENLAGLAAGIEPFYTVYVVPDFDFTQDLHPVVLRPSVDTSFTLTDLTPGDYHVYTVAGDARLEYRNPAALAPLAGQAVALSPGATETLVVEAPGQ